MTDPDPKERSRQDVSKPEETKPDSREGEYRKGVTEEEDHNEYMRPDSREEPDRDNV